MLVFRRCCTHLISHPTDSRWLKCLNACAKVIHIHNNANMVAERRSDAARLARRISDVLVPPIMEEIVKVVKVVFQEQIAERICEQIADVDGSQVAAQDTEVSKTSNRDRTLQRAVEQIFDVPGPEMAKQLVEVPETVSPDRIQQRTVEQIVDAPVPQVVEELAESFKVFSQDRIQQLAVEQTIENPANSIAEMIVEMPVTRKTQQLVNAHVQHVVDTVEVKKPKITELTVQRKSPIIQEKINQVTKPVKIPQVQFLTKVDDMPVVVQRQVSTVQTVQKAMEVPLLRFTDKVVDNPVVVQRQISTEIVQKTMETPQSQCIDEMIDVPVVSVMQVPRACVVKKTVENPQLQTVEKSAEDPQTQTIQGTQTSESLGNAPVSENPLVRFTDRVVDVPVVAQRQVPSIPNVQKTVEVPQIQYVDKIVDAPVVAWTEDVSVGTQTVSRKRKFPLETESADGTSDEEHGLVQGGECRLEVDETRERHAAGEDPDLLPVAPNMEAGGSHLQATAEEERIVDWTQDLREIRRMVKSLCRSGWTSFS